MKNNRKIILFILVFSVSLFSWEPLAHIAYAQTTDVLKPGSYFYAEKQSIKEEKDVSKVELTALLLETESLKEEDYTPASWNGLKKTYEAAKIVELNTDVNQRIVDAHVAAVKAAVKTLINKPKKGTHGLFEGYYTINAKLMHSNIPNKPSMGDAAIKRPVRILATAEELEVEMTFQSLTYLGKKGYLGELRYLTYEGDKPPKISEQAFPAKILEKYEGYDQYNDKDFGSDKFMRGKKYPLRLTVPIKNNSKLLWVKVYVPVMEALTEGSGSQFARLVPDWNTLKPARNPKVNIKELGKQIGYAKKMKKYLAADATYEALTQMISSAQAAYDTLSVKQEQVNAYIIALQKSMMAVGAENGDKTDKAALQLLIDRAGELLNKTGTYTKQSLDLLRKAKIKAENVFNDKEADQKKIDEQVLKLKNAIRALKKNASKKQKKKLDRKKLPDGIYAVKAKMVKIDKSTNSMANNAFNHNVRLDVKKGKYYVSLDFKGMKIDDKLGYLKKLSYFKKGYKFDQYGVPKGSLKSVRVLSYHKEKNGKRVRDVYGSDYPDQVQFELIPEAVSDGYVPLQVFVPVMEAISPGAGTQPVLLKLDWKTLRKTNEKDPAFANQNKPVRASNTNLPDGDLPGGNTLGSFNPQLSAMEPVGGNTSLPDNNVTGSGYPNPQTADYTHIYGFLALAVLSLMSLLVLIIEKRRGESKC